MSPPSAKHRSCNRSGDRRTREGGVAPGVLLVRVGRGLPFIRRSSVMSVDTSWSSWSVTAASSRAGLPQQSAPLCVRVHPPPCNSRFLGPCVPLSTTGDEGREERVGTARQSSGTASCTGPGGVQAPCRRRWRCCWGVLHAFTTRLPRGGKRQPGRSSRALGAGLRYLRNSWARTHTVTHNTLRRPPPGRTQAQSAHTKRPRTAQRCTTHRRSQEAHPTRRCRCHTARLN